MADLGEATGDAEQSTANQQDLKNDSAVSSANKKLLPPVGYDPPTTSTLQAEPHRTKEDELDSTALNLNLKKEPSNMNRNAIKIKPENQK